MPKLSAFLITKNESRDISACLESLRGLVDEVVVVDDHSTDDTVAKCRAFGAKVYSRSLDGFAAQKQFTLEQTSGEWAFSIDADERVAPELAREIRTVINRAPDSMLQAPGPRPRASSLEPRAEIVGYEIRREMYFLGRRLRFGGVGSDWVLRLFKRDRGRFRPARVHERIELEGPVGRLRFPLKHYSYATLEEYLEKRDRYTSLAAQDAWERGRRFSWLDRLRPFWELLARVVLRGAWLDGRAGLRYAALSAQSTWLRAVKLREMRTNKFLIVRTDRLGDVLLTTPVASALREHFPGAHIAWLVRPYTAPLLENNPDVDQVIIDNGGSVGSLADRLRQGRFDAVVVAYPRWRAAWALWRAGIPLRIGPASKPYSVLFSKRIWQHRSAGEKHEADYNLDLLEPLGVPFRRYPARLLLREDERRQARKTLETHRISFNKPVVFLHPGSGSSSARWPLAHFMELGDRLQEAGCDVVVTGGPGEDYQYFMIDHMRRIPVFIAAGSVSVRELAALLSCANLVVTNSTGPLHMAVALGVPTISVYSPVATCHPRRWGPYPAYVEGRSEHTVFVAPETGEGAEKKEDMAGVSVQTLWELCREKLARIPVPALGG